MASGMNRDDLRPEGKPTPAKSIKTAPQGMGQAGQRAQPRLARAENQRRPNKPLSARRAVSPSLQEGREKALRGMTRHAGTGQGLGRGRVFVFGLIMVFVFSAMVVRLWQLHVRDHEVLSIQAQSIMSKTIPLTGSRGTIMDANALPLAYNRRCYDVQFYRDPERKSESERRAYTQVLLDVIRLVEKNGKSTVDTFWLRRNENQEWGFDFGDVKPETAAARERLFRQNFGLKNSLPTQQIFDQLCKNYGIPKDISEEDKIKVLSIWQESRMNAYLSVPVTIAYDVDFLTVSEIEVKSLEWDGISIAESTTRVYPRGALAAHTIGYINRITSPEDLETYRAKGYSTDALVGMTGIEASMEDQLTANISYRRGERVVERNTLGKVIREISYTPPADGNSVMLTLDSRLQAIAERELESSIKSIKKKQQAKVQEEGWQRKYKTVLEEYEKRNQPIQMAETGAMVVMEVDTGRVLANANYPSFDLSMFEDGLSMDEWRMLRDDSRNPMFHRSISAKDTPGSIFKMVTALGGLMEHVVTPDELIDDNGPYEGYDTVHPPRCWSAPNYHGELNLVGGLANSCNYYFFEVGRRLGSGNITKWAARLGLTSKTGIELPSEATSFVGNQNMLYDPDAAINQQYTFKPQYSANKIKQTLIEIGEERNLSYDDDRLDKVVRMLLNVVVEYDLKEEWARQIQQILISEMNLPAEYIQSRYLVNLFQSYLNDLKWTTNETLMCAIGQSITQVTPIAVARYVSAVANGGKVYNAQIIDKIISPDGTVKVNEPMLAANITGADEYFALIRQGMESVANLEDGGTAARHYADSKYKIAVKTGTSQRTKLDVENNAWQVAFAPIEDPKIAVVVYIQNGFAGADASEAVKNVVTAYLDDLQSKEITTMPSGNTLAR